jgi:microcystin synthetase protein McyA
LTSEESNIKYKYKNDSVLELVIDKISLENEDRNNIECSQSSNDRAYIIYTSGSTGTPKGTIIKHKSVINRLFWMQERYQLVESDVIMQKTPYTFDVSVWELFWWSFFGASVCILNQGAEKEPYDIINCVYENKVTVMHFVPSMLKAFLEYVVITYDEKYITQLSSLRTVFSGGEALSLTTVNEFNRILNRDNKKQIVNLYGPTEATVDVSYYDCTDLENLRIMPIGAPISNTRLYVMRNGKLCPIGMKGELCIGGIGLAEGYLGNEELTNEKFQYEESIGERIYKTGDDARVLFDGNIEYLGRNDNQVKIRGFRVELDEIENLINEKEFVSDSVVFVDEDKSNSKQLVACIVLRSSEQSNELILDEMKNEQVSTWAEVFDDKYSYIQKKDRNTFNTIGWESSYTGNDFDKSEMTEWLSSAVNNIKRFDLGKVLEIGCGTGMIMFSVLPFCELYLGTDVSTEAVDFVKDIVNNNIREFEQKVQICKMSADEVGSLTEKNFNMVILNSVIQYFPTVNYLSNIINTAIDHISGTGCIFIGDVRNYDLSHEFYTSLALAQASPKTTIEEIVSIAKKYTLQDNELLISPEFFIELENQIEEVTGVEILHKKTKYRNEMSSFRYDVILHIRNDEKISVDIEKEYFLGLDLEKILEVEDWNILKINNVPNELNFQEVLVKEIFTENRNIITVDEAFEIYDTHYKPKVLYSRDQLISFGEKYECQVLFYYSGCEFKEKVNVVYVKNDSWDDVRLKKFQNNPQVTTRNKKGSLSSIGVKYFLRYRKMFLYLFMLRIKRFDF